MGALARTAGHGAGTAVQTAGSAAGAAAGQAADNPAAQTTAPAGAATIGTAAQATAHASGGHVTPQRVESAANTAGTARGARYARSDWQRRQRLPEATWARADSQPQFCGQ